MGSVRSSAWRSCIRRQGNTTRRSRSLRTPDPVNITPIDLLQRQIAEEVRRVPHRIDTAFRGVRALVNPRQALSTALRYGRSVPRVAGLVSPPGSPLLAHRSLSWRFSAFEVPFTGLKAAATAAKSSVNDVYLAGLIGGFRIYHEKMGTPVETMPVAIPISVRRPEDPAGGNRIAVGRLAGPVGIADPFERVLTIREQVRQARHEPAVDIFNTLGSVMAWLPGTVLMRFSGTTSQNDLQASNVPPGIPLGHLRRRRQGGAHVPVRPAPPRLRDDGHDDHPQRNCLSRNQFRRCRRHRSGVVRRLPGCRIRGEVLALVADADMTPGGELKRVV